ncbi:MAG: hypothetical protein CMP23_02395 [Rickettsiales bacterium]|nr:hypothetical protein [Rickettsiales bacterium]
MPPLAKHIVVGTGLRAFANGEGLRLRGHEVFYCTRREDLLQAGAAPNKRTIQTVIEVKGENHPPGDLKRISAPTDSALVSAAESSATSALRGRAAKPKGQSVTSGGLASTGGAAGAPGNPFAFTDTHELHTIVRHVDPDVVLVEAPEEARRLPQGSFRVILDLFAPRILEQQFQQGGEERDTVRVLDALQRADGVLFSNHRQRYYHLPLLALAGIDCTDQIGSVVPISGPAELPSFAKPKTPIFVAGGVFWPWADLGPGLAALHACLKKEGLGTIHLYGGEYGIRSDTENYSDPRTALPKKSKHLKFKGMVPIDKLWKDYSRGSVAFDLMKPNPERELNLSFRQIDYLRCGLPIITAPTQVIADKLLEYGAGWCLEPGDDKALNKLVKKLLAEPERIERAASAAQRLAAEQFTWEIATESLDQLTRTVSKREHRETVVNRLSRTQADLWQEHEENKRLRETVLHLQDDQEKKSAELRKLNDRLGLLLGSVDRLSGSLTAVSRFKNDALLFLHEQEDAALREAAELATEVERLELDIKKKDAAIKAGKRELGKAARALAKQEELIAVELEKKDKEADSAAKEARAELDSLEQQLSRQAEQHRTALAKKDRELSGLRRDLKAEQDATTKALAAQEQRLESEIAKKETDLAAAAKASKTESKKAEAARARQQVRFGEEVDKKDREIAALGLELQKTQAAGARALTRLEEQHNAALEKKEDEVNRLGEERTLLQKRLDLALENNQTQNDTLAAARVAISDLEGRISLAENQMETSRLEVERLKDRLDQARFEHRKMLGELDKKEREVSKAQNTRDSTKAKLEAAAKKLEERLSKAEFIERNLLEEAAKKDIEVKEAQVERDTMKAGLEASISSLEERLARAEFEYRTLVEEAAKKDGEIQELTTLNDNIKTRLTNDFKRLEAEKERVTVKAGSLEGRLEETRFQVQVLQSEIEKKNDEIADAQARRDALAEALQEERAQHARGGVLLRRRLKGEFLGRSKGD